MESTCLSPVLRASARRSWHWSARLLPDRQRQRGFGGSYQRDPHGTLPRHGFRIVHGEPSRRGVGRRVASQRLDPRTHLGSSRDRDRLQRRSAYGRRPGARHPAAGASRHRLYLADCLAPDAAIRNRPYFTSKQRGFSMQYQLIPEHRPSQPRNLGLVGWIASALGSKTLLGCRSNFSDSGSASASCGSMSTS